MAHLLDDPLPEGLFPPDEAAIVVLARKSTRMEPIDNGTWANVREHFDTKQIMEIIFTIGMDQMVSRFHAIVRTDVDDQAVVHQNRCPGDGRVARPVHDGRVGDQKP